MRIAPAKRLERVREYYFATKLREVAKLNAEGRDVINLGIGNPDLPPHPDVISKLNDSSQEASHHGYQPYRGIAELREGISDFYLRNYDVDLDPDREVLPLIGSKEGIFHISMAFLDPGDQALVPDPGYPGYASAVQLAGAEPVSYHLLEEDNWGPDWDQLKSLDTSKIKIMWVNYPHMPTGAKLDNDNWRRLLDFARNNNILICHDNPYSFLLNDQPVSALQFDAERDHILELNSLSKIFNMSGWRVGMVCGHQQYIETIMKVKSNVDSGMFLPVQHAACVALKLPQSWYDTQNYIYETRKKRVCEILDLLGCSYKPDTPGMFVWAKLPDRISDVETFIDEILYQANVFITPGFIFGSRGSRYIRLSLCVNENRTLEALSRIQNHLVYETI